MIKDAQAGDSDAWDAYLRSRHVPPSAVWAWRSIMADSYGNPTFFLLARHRSGKIAGQLALYETRDWRGHVRLYSFRHGFLADDTTAANLLAEAALRIARRRNATSVVVTSGYFPLGLDFRHWTKTSVVLKLSPDLQTMWTTLRDKVRNMVRKGERAGLVCERNALHLDSFYFGYTERLGAKAVPLHSRRFFEAMLKRSDAVLYSAIYDGRAIGGMIFQYGTSTATYFQSTFLPSAASLGVGQFLMWQAVQDCIGRAVTAVDMGESEPDSGVFNFKTLFGGEAQAVHYYDLVQAAHLQDNQTEYRASGFGTIVARLPLVLRKPVLRVQRRVGRIV